MLGSNKEKELTKGEIERKANAWKTLNEVLIKANSEFMANLKKILADKIAVQDELKKKLEEKVGTEDDNAEYIFVGGYIQALKDILGANSSV